MPDCDCLACLLLTLCDYESDDAYVQDAEESNKAWAAYASDAEESKEALKQKVVPPLPLAKAVWRCDALSCVIATGP